MIRALVFDLDGTLANTEMLHFKAWREALLQNGVAEFTLDDFLRYVGTSNEKVANDYIQGNGLKKSQKELITQKQTLYMELIPEVELCTGTKEILERFQGQMSLAVASSSHEKEIRAILEIQGLISYFPVILGGDMVEKRKPDPEIYLKAQTLLGMGPGECVAFEDSGPGINAAKNAGMKAIAIPNEFTQGHDFTRADSIVPSFDAVSLQLLQGL
ncbi:MAG: HAD superfamily hydrolase (TIGR01509 family) [Desulforhopalus sp.]|jgi:HAD superfamily hydrolase (TIGR01509 family)